MLKTSQATERKQVRGFNKHSVVINKKEVKDEK